MKQAWHIFHKDVRYLRLEVALVTTLAATFAALGGEPGSAWWAEMLYIIAAAHLIARLVHAEAIPGTRQFWITRPYRASSLLAAKLCFALVFVSLPLCLAQLYIAIQAGFPASSIVPGLLWSQAVAYAAIILPVTALAALTAGIVPFIFAALVLLAVGFGTQQMMWMQLPRFPAGPLWPSPVEWVRESALAVALASTAAGVLYLQYRYRWTRVSRALAIIGVTAAAATYLYMPTRFALASQLRLSDKTVDSDALTVRRDSAAKLSMGPIPGRPEQSVQIRVPLIIPSNEFLVPDAFEVTLEGDDGRLRSVGSGGVNPTGRVAERFEATALVQGRFVKQAANEELTARGAIWLTVFQQSDAKAVRLRDGPVNVFDGLQCYPGAFRSLWCRSAFRWPKKLISAKVSDNDVRRLTSLISYSPFPGSPRFNPLEARWAPGTIQPDDGITMIAHKPIAHVRRDFDIGKFRFSDLVAGR